ncbi:hypothetical protein [Falsiroseomonas sp. HW251]|uniref:hypothetical protein n=1 Tax=Falsiroseomonas sp. HW251 TaxID=3390998 RepID=UPI003D320BDB
MKLTDTRTQILTAAAATGRPGAACFQSRCRDWTGFITGVCRAILAPLPEHRGTAVEGEERVTDRSNDGE